MRRHAAKVAELVAQRDVWNPPAFLAEDAAVVWRETVDSVSADHFAQGDVAVLARFCQIEARCRKLTRAEERMPAWTTDPEKRRAMRQLVSELNSLRSLQSTLTRILRLGPSTRPLTRQQRTDMPTHNPDKARKAAADDLFAC